MIPEDVTGSFHQDVSGPVPQNTGVSQYDLEADRAIGASAQQGWEVADQRLQEKRTILGHHPEASGYDLSRNPDGTYRVLTAEERAVHDRALAINDKAMNQDKEEEPPK